MYLSEYAESQRLLRVTARARTDRVIRPRFKAADAPAAANGDIVEEERRSASRVLISDEIVVRRVGAGTFSVAITNLSTDGCQIELVDGYRDGDDLIARFPKLEPLGAKVRWADARRAGIRFSRGIHPAVFEFLLGRMKTAATA